MLIALTALNPANSFSQFAMILCLKIRKVWTKPFQDSYTMQAVCDLFSHLYFFIGSTLLIEKSDVI